MSYNFQNLSPADFEDLVRDLLGYELGVRFEAFAAGPDDGIDGRHSKGAESTILQAKHYAGSTFAKLKVAVKKERPSIDQLAAERYVLATSKPLSPQNKSDLAKIIGPSLKDQGDIFGAGDINGLLRKFPDVEKSNIKLWLSGTAILERIIQSAAYAFTAMSRAEIEAKVRVYAQNPSFSQAKQNLEANHVLIISGPPGVGKTTLAEMLSYAYIGEEWEFVAIRSLEDGFARIVDTKKQVFFFDDFLGKVALDVRSLASKDSDLVKFIKRVGSAKNARFILTTRAYIFEEARRFSEHLADKHLEIMRYLLDVGIYTRRIKARILYNHLAVSDTSPDHIKALSVGLTLAKIVDHKNYNPRIIEAMTDTFRLKEIDAECYPKAFIDALDNPHQLWDIAFRTHITPMCRHLLFTLFFCSEYGADINSLKDAFDALHPVLCRSYGLSHDAKDFESALRVLEGSFVNIRGTTVSFLNPSLRDYLDIYLDDIGLLTIFATTSQKVRWAREVWRHVRRDDRFKPEDHETIAKGFHGIAQSALTNPVWKRDSRAPHSLYSYDIDISDRIELLLDWFTISGDANFSLTAFALANNPPGGFSTWQDGKKLIDLISSLRGGEYEGLKSAEELADVLEQGLIQALNGSVFADDLDTLSDAIDEHRDQLNVPVVSALHRAIVREIDDVLQTTADMDSQSTLSDHAQLLEKLGRSIGMPEETIEKALEPIGERIAQIEASATKAPPPKFSDSATPDTDLFDDDALRNLFVTLATER